MHGSQFLNISLSLSAHNRRQGLDSMHPAADSKEACRKKDLREEEAFQTYLLQVEVQAMGVWREAGEHHSGLRSGCPGRKHGKNDSTWERTSNSNSSSINHEGAEILANTDTRGNCRTVAACTVTCRSGQRTSSRVEFENRRERLSIE